MKMFIAQLTRLNELVARCNHHTDETADACSDDTYDALDAAIQLVVQFQPNPDLDTFSEQFDDPIFVANLTAITRACHPDAISSMLDAELTARKLK